VIFTWIESSYNPLRLIGETQEGTLGSILTVNGADVVADAVLDSVREAANPAGDVCPLVISSKIGRP
jgi:hypothetical protein